VVLAFLRFFTSLVVFLLFQCSLTVTSFLGVMWLQSSVSFCGLRGAFFLKKFLYLSYDWFSGSCFAIGVFSLFLVVNLLGGRGFVAGLWLYSFLGVFFILLRWRR